MGIQNSSKLHFISNQSHINPKTKTKKTQKLFDSHKQQERDESIAREDLLGQAPGLEPREASVVERLALAPPALGISRALGLGDQVGAVGDPSPSGP